MLRRTYLASAASVAVAAVPGCLTDGEREIDPAAKADPGLLVEVSDAEFGLSRAVGPERPGGEYTIGDALAFEVRDEHTGEAVFDFESTTESAEAFFRETEFDSHALVQIEHVVPSRSYSPAYTGFSVSEGTGVVRYEVRETGEFAPQRPAFGDILLRVDVERGAIDDLVARRGEDTFEVLPASDL